MAKLSELSKTRKYFLLVGICVAFLDFGLLLSLQPTFYPTEAEAKGATPSQYGFVFGVVNLASFFCAPLYGRYGDVIGAKLLYNTGGIMQGLGGIVFGLLEYVDDTQLFIILSYLLRFIEGAANAACNSTVSGLLVQMFPNKIASVIGQTRMFLSIGYMLGPVIGSLLYTWGGYGLPFYVIGSIALVVATYQIIVLPRVDGADDDEEKIPLEEKIRRKEKAAMAAEGFHLSSKNVNENLEELEALKENDETGMPGMKLKDVLMSPSIMVPCVNAFTCFTGNGMTEAMLEPHLKNDAGASQLEVAWTFFILGATYLVAMPTVGYLLDNYSNNKIVFSMFGNVLIISSFVLLGPLPFIPIEPSVGLIMTGISLAGIGYAIIIVSSFARAHAAALEAGFANNIRTNLVVAGVWTASFNLGAFSGPTSAGFLVESIGFRGTCFVYVWIYVIVFTIDAAQLIHARCTSRAKKESRNGKYQPL